MLSADGFAGMVAGAVSSGPSSSHSQVIEESMDQSRFGTQTGALTYDSASQLDDLFGGSTGMVFTPLTAPVSEAEPIFAAASDDVGTTPASETDDATAAVNNSVASGTALAVVQTPVRESVKDASVPVSPDTISPVAESVETLRAANGPPANGDTPLVAAGGPFTSSSITAGTKQAITDGLTALGNWANSLDSYSKLAANLPLIGRNIGQMLDMGGILLSYLRDPISAYFASDATPTTDEYPAIRY